MKNALIVMLILTAVGAVHAAEPPPLDRLSLSTSASVEVTRDVLALSFSTTKEGTDAAAVQLALKLALDAALKEARKIAKPGEVEVQTGNFSLNPRYAPQVGNSGGQMNGWQGTAELLVEGRDTAAIAQLSGRINTLTIGRVAYNLSKEQREKVEGEVAAQAIARYKARAADYARQFGYSGFQIAEVNVNTAEASPMMSMAPQMRFKTTSASSDEALPVEAGKATVSVTVNGVVKMSR